VPGCSPPAEAGAGGIIAYEIGTADVGLASAGYSARAQDASTVLTNPAGMTRLEGNQFLFAGQLDYGRTEFSVGSGTSPGSAPTTAVTRSGRTAGSSAAADSSATACRPSSSSGSR
jgi:long-subunit fatty acid transport protein